jgi:HAD superfamily hydrolase (TIGR01549 family)
VTDSAESLVPPHAVLFDLDGTLTCPLLDFERIRRDMGIAAGLPILEAMSRMGEPARAGANEILLRHEREAALAAALNPGCHEVLHFLRERGTPMAVITRNSLDSTRIVLETHRIAIKVLVTREDEPYKPRPEPVFLALERLGVNTHPEHIWMVGDGEHDIAAANAAGIRSIWLSHGRERAFPSRPSLEIPDLFQLLRLLQGRSPDPHDGPRAVSTRM